MAEAELSPLIAAPFNEGDAVYHWMREQGLTRTRLAKLSKRRRNTITDLINNNVETEPNTLRDVLTALGKDEDQCRALVNQMNGKGNVVFLRPPETRERKEDLDKDLNEAIEFGHRYVALPDDAKMAIYNVLRAFERAFRPK